MMLERKEKIVGTIFWGRQEGMCNIRRLAVAETQTPMNRNVSEGVGAGIDNG